MCAESFKFASASLNTGDHSYSWASTGLDWSSLTTRTLSLSVPANTPPSASNSKVTTEEDTSYTFAADEFRFVDIDADVGDTLTSVIVTSLPGRGALNFDHTALTATDLPKTVTATELGEGKLVYDPPASGTGEPFASFQFKVHDGTVQSTAAATMRIDVLTNLAPDFGAATATRTLEEDIGVSTTAIGVDIGAALTATDTDTVTYTLEGTDADSFDIDAGTGQLKTKAGVLYDFEAKSSYTVTVKADDGREGADTIEVTVEIVDQDEPPLAVPTPTVTAANVTSLEVSWTAPDNPARPAITSYDVQYREGTAGAWLDGPQDVPDSPTTIAALEPSTGYQLQVRASNDEGDGPWSTPPGSETTTTNAAPRAQPSRVETAEGADHTFAASEFRYTDTEGDALTNVIVTTLPASGTGELKFDGTAIVMTDLPKTITTTELGERKLVYDPPATGNGMDFASFEFKVHDGLVESAASATMTVDVATEASFCATPNLAGRRQIWTTELTVGRLETGGRITADGFSESNAIGMLSDTMFQIGANSLHSRRCNL